MLDRSASRNDPGAPAPTEAPYCRRCGSKDTLSLGRVRSGAVWFSCRQCNYVWRVEEEEERTRPRYAQALKEREAERTRCTQAEREGRRPSG